MENLNLVSFENWTEKNITKGAALVDMLKSGEPYFLLTDSENYGV